MQIDNVVCAFCGCVCDDISVTVEDGRITQAKNACVLGKAWFLSHGQPSDRPAAMMQLLPLIIFPIRSMSFLAVIANRRCRTCSIGS